MLAVSHPFCIRTCTETCSVISPRLALPIRRLYIWTAALLARFKVRAITKQGRWVIKNFRSSIGVALLLTGTLGSQLRAQEVSGASLSTVAGIAVDSVRGGYLRDAIVSVLGTKRIGITDSLGRFRIDSVPAGSRALRLSHPLLDTLGLSVTTNPAQ